MVAPEFAMLTARILLISALVLLPITAWATPQSDSPTSTDHAVAEAREVFGDAVPQPGIRREPVHQQPRGQVAVGSVDRIPVNGMEFDARREPMPLVAGLFAARAGHRLA